MGNSAADMLHYMVMMICSFKAQIGANVCLSSAIYLDPLRGY